MPPEYGFWIAPNWPQIGNITVTLQFTDMTSSSYFLKLLCFSSQV